MSSRRIHGLARCVGQLLIKGLLSFLFFFLSSEQVEKLNSSRWRPKYQLGYKVIWGT